jgi:nucleoside 2-deoxyribosyltransferase
MPFSDYYLNELYPEVIKPTVEEGNNLKAHHAGETLGPGIIVKDIENDISQSKIVIADISECNTNVYYEVGYAYASKIPTIVLVKKDTKLPFDISGYRCIFYENTLGGKRKIIERLQKEIGEILGR